MQAAACAFDLAIEPRDLALLCQRAENLVAGAPCGVMDQMTCVFGERARADGAVVPAGRTAGAGRPAARRDRVGHRLGRASRGERLGLRIGARRGVHGSANPCRSPARSGRIPCELSTPRSSSASPRHLPEEMGGDEFLARYDGTSDHVTTVAAGAAVPRPRGDRPPGVRASTSRDVSRAAAGTRPVTASGARSGRADVRVARELRPLRARVARNRSPGGACEVAQVPPPACMGRGLPAAAAAAPWPWSVGPMPSPAIARIADQYERETGHRPYVFAGSSPGVARGRRSGRRVMSEFAMPYSPIVIFKPS